MCRAGLVLPEQPARHRAYELGYVANRMLQYHVSSDKRAAQGLERLNVGMLQHKHPERSPVRQLQIARN